MYLATKVQDPSVDDEMKLKRVEQYLSTTINTYIKVKPTSLQVNAYVDASFSVHDDAKGHTGICIHLGDGPGAIYCRSVKQKLVSRSSTESELLALDEAVSYVLWFRDLSNELGFIQRGPTNIYLSR